MQLDVPGGKMVADQVLVKYDMLGEIEDVVVLENKLKDITDYTTRQKSGWGQINSHKSLTVRSSAAEDKLGKGLELVQCNSLPVSNVIRVDGNLSGEFNDVRAVIEDLTKY